MKTNFLFVILLSLFLTSSSFGAGSKRESYSAPSRTHYSTTSRSPWDFSGMFILNNPGSGFGGLVAYRLFDGLLKAEYENNLVFESGLNYVSYTSPVSFGYSIIEIPLRTRWDFRLADGKILAGPVAGFVYQLGTSVNWFGTTYNYGSALVFQLGASGVYYFNENFGARAQLTLGGATSLTLGINYTP